MNDFQSIRDFFTNREIAAIAWLLVVLVWLIFNSSVRGSIAEVLKAFWNKYIIISIVALILYSSLLILVFHKFNFWHASNIKDTIYWFFGVAFVMLVNVSKADEEYYFKRVLLSSIKLAVFLEFLIKLYDLDLWLELILVPFITLVLMLMVVAGTDEKYSQLHKILGKIQVAFGLSILLYVAYNIVSDFSGFATLDHVQEFLLPLTLTIAYLPFIYAAALYSKYEEVFVRLHLFNDDQELIKFTKRKIMLKYHFNLCGLNKWAKKRGALKVKTKRDVLELVNDE